MDKEAAPITLDVWHAAWQTKLDVDFQRDQKSPADEG